MIKVKATPELRAFAGTQVGWVKVNKPFTYERTFEIAAWRQTLTATCATYMVNLHVDYKGEVYLLAKVNATVTDSYMPSLWGGVPIPGTRADRDVGNAGEIPLTLDIVDMICNSRTIPGADKDVYLDDSIVDMVLRALRTQLSEMMEYYRKCERNYDCLGDGEYHTHLRGVMYAGKCVDEIGQAIVKIEDCLSFRAKNVSEYWTQVYAKNTAWVPYKDIVAKVAKIALG